jgi:glycogen operon protein
VGKEMSDSDWNAGFVRCLGMRLEGHMVDEVDDRGRAIVGDTLLILLNSHSEMIPFRLPSLAEEEYWRPLLDTAHRPLHSRLRADDLYPLQGRTIAVLKLQHESAETWLSRLPSWFGRRSRRRAAERQLAPQHDDLPKAAESAEAGRAVAFVMGGR